mgnify:CR=1
MYSDKDFQTFWFRYKTEGELYGISINFYVLLRTNGHQKGAILAFLAADCSPGKLNGGMLRNM